MIDYLWESKLPLIDDLSGLAYQYCRLKEGHVQDTIIFSVNNKWG